MKNILVFIVVALAFSTCEASPRKHSKAYIRAHKANTQRIIREWHINRSWRALQDPKFRQKMYPGWFVPVWEYKL